MFGLSPYLILGTVIGSLLLSGAAYFKGDADAANRYQAKIATMQLEANEAAEAEQQKRQAAFMEASSNYEGKNAEAKIVFRTITRDVNKIVERPVYRDVCLDDDGLRLAQLALGGTAVAPPGSAESHAGMPRVITPQ